MKGCLILLIMGMMLGQEVEIVMNADMKSDEYIKRNTVEDNWFGKDKIKHFTASFYLAAASRWLGRHRYNIPQGEDIWVGIGFSFSVGVLKEIHDKKDYGLFSWKDIVYDLFGALCGAILLNW